MSVHSCSWPDASSIYLFNKSHATQASWGRWIIKSSVIIPKYRRKLKSYTVDFWGQRVLDFSSMTVLLFNKEILFHHPMSYGRAERCLISLDTNRCSSQPFNLLIICGEQQSEEAVWITSQCLLTVGCITLEMLRKKKHIFRWWFIQICDL